MEEEKARSYYVTTVDMGRINKDMDVAFEKVEDLKESLGNIFKAIEVLEPQQKLFFLDKVLMDIILKSQMPVFYLNGLLTKMSDYLKEMEDIGGQIPLEEKEYKPSYLG